jgi:hypothetical protein
MATKRDHIGMLAKLLEDANTKIAGRPDSDPFGMCEWTDIEGNPRCNSPWSQFQCEQAGGTFTPGASCPPEKRQS